jgi:25S rRNA (uracil2634-N3)-methyltransferase
MNYEEIESKAFIYWIKTGIRININDFINSFEYKSLLREINFIEEISKGNIFFVGEGNFSFALRLARQSLNKSSFIATAFEDKNEISKEVQNNIKQLLDLGVKVLFNIDGTKLENYFKTIKFDRIIFNFPNTASRNGKYGKTHNYYLLKNFLKSCINVLNYNGKIIITLVDTSYYKGAFDYENLNIKEYNNPEICKFNPSRFKGYIHTKTHEEESGLDKYDDFISLVFSLK